jgi:DNA repair protein RecN (Recombination protein N)
VLLSTCGIDKVEFLFTPNPVEGAKTLSGIASGCELSRVMLALKSILAEADRTPTLIFDEVDAGIGGQVAEVVGKKLKAVAEKRQVFCITHLPQIAAMAAHHYRVEKVVSGGRNVTTIRKLSPQERLEEIARMSGGERITKATLAHAKELLKNR